MSFPIACRRASWVLLLGVAPVLAFEFGLLAQSSPRASVQRHVDPCAAPANEIVAENCKPGSPSVEWDINGDGDPTIQGFSTDVSVNLGETVYFKIKTDSPKYRIDIYRMGYYGGMGARLVATIRPSATLPQIQPECISDPVTLLYDCGNWGVSASWAVPKDATSGQYFARLTREDPGGTWRADNAQAPPSRKPGAAPHAYGASGFGKLRIALKEPRASHIYFAVRDDNGRSDILLQVMDPGWQAYNSYGGASTYGSTHNGVSMGQYFRANKVSFNRPLSNRRLTEVNQPFHDEYPLIRWLERNGYDVSYFSGVDADRRGEEIKEHKVYLGNGHDEYWSGGQRRNVEAARDAGVNMIFLSGNDIFWKVRYEPSIDGSNTPYRTLVCYKETHDRITPDEEYRPGRKIDPKKDEWTGTWRDASAYNPEGPYPENALIGMIFTVNSWGNNIIEVPAEYGKMRFWRNTSVSKLKPGETAKLVESASLGHEWDEDIDNGFRPAGLVHLSETVAHGVRYLMDWGSIYDTGTATHRLTMYRAASGALVFATGTTRWAWGLDPFHDNMNAIPASFSNRLNHRVLKDKRPPDGRIQQATVNMLADMGVQPTTLGTGLVPATPSTDRRPPSSTVTLPAQGATVQSGTMAVHGTAADSGGGVVANVEVSVDGGKTWHPAKGRETWSYEWKVPAGAAELKIMSRAADDSGNLERPGTNVTARAQ